MPRAIVYLIYNALLPLVLLIGMPAFIIKGIRRGGLARHFRQRFGHFPPALRARWEGTAPLWIHAVSVGEVFIALKLIDAILAHDPRVSIVLSTTTTTGYDIASGKASDRVSVIHNPLDLPWITRRVIRLISPSQFILIESELWPNLIRQLNQQNIPVRLANARLSPRSEKRYLAAQKWIEPVLSQLNAVSVPFAIDRERWASLGIPLERISVLGSIKFDHADAGGAVAEKSKELAAWLHLTGCPEGARLLVAGSTHAGEEALLAETTRRLKQDFPSLQLVIVPRHAERGREISHELTALGFRPRLRQSSDHDRSTGSISPPDRVSSDTTPSPAHPSPDDLPVWIANTTGELRAWYHLAEVVMVGKSFCGQGGQNPVEPILTGRPVVVGPEMQNFSDVIADLLSVRGIAQVNDGEALYQQLHDWLTHPETGTATAHRGAAAMTSHLGAAERHAIWLLD